MLAKSISVAGRVAVPAALKKKLMRLKPPNVTSAVVTKNLRRMTARRAVLRLAMRSVTLSSKQLQLKAACSSKSVRKQNE